MTTESLDAKESVFDKISDKRASRDANARNCARDVLAKNLGTALRYAEAMQRDEADLVVLFAEMNELHPKE